MDVHVSPEETTSVVVQSWPVIPRQRGYACVCERRGERGQRSGVWLAKEEVGGERIYGEGMLTSPRAKFEQSELMVGLAFASWNLRTDDTTQPELAQFHIVCGRHIGKKNRGDARDREDRRRRGNGRTKQRKKRKNARRNILCRGDRIADVAQMDSVVPCAIGRLGVHCRSEEGERKKSDEGGEHDWCRCRCCGKGW